jgi:hypothetical protein
VPRELTSPARWVRRQLAEIAADPALQAYGACLPVTHLLSALVWARVQPLAAVLDPAREAICWPFFERCWAWRLLGPAALNGVLVAYAALGVTTVLLFAAGGRVRAAWLVLAAATALKLAILVQDYRFRLNQHYIAFWATALFLLVPHKRRVLPYLLVASYVWAGTLKLNREWLSGAALLGARPYLVPEALVPLACAYVVVLELAVAPLLLARRAWLFWPALAQIVAFHLVSWNVVGFFYPTLMLAVLAILPLLRWLRPPASEADPALARLVTGREVAPAYAVLGTFAALQLLPWLYPGDAAITGEGRLFALHMFDAPVECRATATLRHADGRVQRVPLFPHVAARIRCDPIVYLSVAHALCRRFHGRAGFVDLDLDLRSRRAGSAPFRPVVAMEGFCRARPTYDLWRHNRWIRTD